MEMVRLPSGIPAHTGPEAAAKGGAGAEQTEILRESWYGDGEYVLVTAPLNPQDTEGLRMVWDASAFESQLC